MIQTSRTEIQFDLISAVGDSPHAMSTQPAGSHRSSELKTTQVSKPLRFEQTTTRRSHSIFAPTTQSNPKPKIHAYTQPRTPIQPTNTVQVGRAHNTLEALAIPSAQAVAPDGLVSETQYLLLSQGKRENNE